MNTYDVLQLMSALYEKLPKLPDGRIDYAQSDIAVVMTAFIKYEDKILLLKRSARVGSYRQKWSTVTGYLDELQPIHEKIYQEIREELGITRELVQSIHIGEPFEFIDTRHQKTWVICPAIVELNERPQITLDWEHAEFRWIRPEELEHFDIVPKLDQSWEHAVR